MEAVRRLTLCLVPAVIGIVTSSNSSNSVFISKTEGLRFSSAEASPSSKWGGWFARNKRVKLPNIVQAGDPVLHDPAREVDPAEIKSEKVQNMIDDMIRAMRKDNGVGLAAPQIGIPLRIICLEDKKEWISNHSEEEMKAQDRRPFDLLVCPSANKMILLKWNLILKACCLNNSHSFSSLETGDLESQAEEDEQKNCPIF